MQKGRVYHRKFQYGLVETLKILLKHGEKRGLREDVINVSILFDVNSSSGTGGVGVCPSSLQ